MASTRMCKAAIGFAASALLCGTLVFAQEPTGAPGSSGRTPSGATPSSQAPTPAGSMPGSSATGMQDNSSMNNMSGKVSADDKHFMKEAMEGDMAEIQLAQLAQQKAASDQVKQFAQRMIDDHTKLDAQMKPIAQQFGVEAPTELSAKHKAVQTKLQSLSGDKFDEEYVKAMVSDHSQDHQAFLREQTAAKDPTLKNAVSQGEPIIADHLRMAQDLEKSLKGKGSSSM